jgi:uncharacterized repeat protein (TIGR03803 family)
MSHLAVSQCALGISVAAALLAGCVGPQLPIGAPGAMPQSRATAAEQSRVHPAYSVLHSFGGSGDGAYPSAGLLNVKGMLFGTTTGGGKTSGTVFAITTSGIETVRHSFGVIGSGDGAYPWAPVINVNGMLYGTTEAGGQTNPSGTGGTVFSMTPSGKEAVLYSFSGAPYGDGASPYAGLLDVNGTLYGTDRTRRHVLRLRTRRLRNGVRNHDVWKGKGAPQFRRRGRRRDTVCRPRQRQWHALRHDLYGGRE